MTKKFEFKKNSAELNINGQFFNIELTGKIITECDRIKEGAGKHFKSITEGDNAEKAIEDACDFLADGIDVLLGKGSAKKIFGDKTITLFDLTDVVGFIRTEIIAAIQKKSEEYGAKK